MYSINLLIYEIEDKPYLKHLITLKGCSIKKELKLNLENEEVFGACGRSN